MQSACLKGAKLRHTNTYSIPSSARASTPNGEEAIASSPQ
jgi:hypothetical protein